MQELRIGIDVDGVVANFNAGYRKMLIAVSGRDLIPETFEPPCWEYASVYGYTKEEDKKAWQAIRESEFFWRLLKPLPDARDFLTSLDDFQHAIYFITTRPGTHVKGQTETWLKAFLCNPTVLIAKSSEDKGLLAKGLGLTHFIDDKPENCIAVKEHVPTCKVYLLDAAYNRWTEGDFRYDQGVIRIYTLDYFEFAIGRDANCVVAA